MSSITVNIGGVPEHFNYPWYLLLRSKELEKDKINLRWHDYDGGTGAMIHSLIRGDLDLAVMLTEGVVKAISDRAPIKLIQYYVASPLIWGIHTHPRSELSSRAALLERTQNHPNEPINVAISRYGSGSHLMAYLYAKSIGIDPGSAFSFREVGDLSSALEELKDGQSDIFLWEKFTTQPYVEQYGLKRIDAYPTPWPCFVLAGREDFVDQYSKSLQIIQNKIKYHVQAMRQRPELVSELAARYQQEPQAIESWLAQTRWSQDPIDQMTLRKVETELAHLGLIKESRQ